MQNILNWFFGGKSAHSAHLIERACCEALEPRRLLHCSEIYDGPPTGRPGNLMHDEAAVHAEGDGVETICPGGRPPIVPLPFPDPNPNPNPDPQPPGRAYAKLTAAGGVISELAAKAPNNKVFQDLFGIIRRKRRQLGQNANPYNVMQAVIQDAAVRQGKYDTVLHLFVGQTMKEVYDAANGDYTKVPTYSQLSTLLANRAERALLESHHTATNEWTRKLLRNQPPYQQYTPQQWNALFNDMPAIGLNQLEHGTGEFAKGYGGFHEVLRQVLPFINK